MHAAHGGADDQPRVIDPQASGQQQVLGLDHVVIVVVREAGVQAVGRLGRLPVADAVREDDVVAADVEQGARPEQHARELRPDEVMPLPAGAMQDHDGVDHMTRRIAAWRAEGGVVDPQFRQALARVETEVVDHEVAFVGRGSGRARRLGLGHARGDGTEAEPRR